MPRTTAYLLNRFPNDINIQALIWLAAASRNKSKTGELPEQWIALRVKYTHPFKLYGNEGLLINRIIRLLS